MNEWKDWYGDENSPVAHNAIVEIRLRDGSNLIRPAGVLDWVHDRDFENSDIVQFREIEDRRIESSVN